jgi:MFS family permease
MPQVQVPTTEFHYTKKQIVLGLVAAFSIYAVSFYYLHTMGVARPRMAAELNGMPLFSWLISIPGLAGALVTILFSKFSDIYGRRLLLMVSLSFCLLGTILSAVSPTFVSLIIANSITSLGLGALIPLCLSVLGDMFAPTERSKWVGLLNIPAGIFALCGPTLGGLGFGAIPTISTIVAQCVVPKRMIGIAMGVLFFNLSLSMTIAPAILGSAMNIKYADSLRASLPNAVHQFADKETMTSLGDPSVLLLKPAMSKLRGKFDTMGNNGQALFAETVQAIKTSLQSGLSIVFLIGAGTMLLAFLFILAIPEISMDVDVQDKRAPESFEEPRLLTERP